MHSLGFFFSDMKHYEVASLILQVITIGVLVVYTIYTYKMAQASEENISLTKELQTKESFPTIALTIEKVSIPQTYGQIETLFLLHNTSRYNAKVWVTVEATVNGKPYDWSRLNEKKYSGLEPWPVPAFLKVQGHFDFLRIMPAGSIAIPPTSRISPPPKDALAINVKYKWTDLEGKRIQEGMDQRWYYDFMVNQWVFDI